MIEDGLSAASAGELRRLRFDDSTTELDFRNDYARRRLPQIRVVFWIGLGLQIPLSVRAVLLDGMTLDDPRFWARLAVGVVPAVTGLLLARRSGFLPWQQTYMVFYSLLIGAVLVALFAPQPLGWARLMAYPPAAVVLPRLRTRAAVAVLGGLIGWFVVLLLAVLHRPIASVALGLVNLVLLGFFLTGAAYLLEHSARRDFVLMRLLADEREKSERLLLNVLPAPIAERLKQDAGTIADSFTEVTVLFADIADFTPNTARLEPEEVVELLNRVFSRFDALAAAHGLEKIKTVGDSYMVVGGLPEPRPDHAEAVVAMAIDMQAAVANFRWPRGGPLALRVGINTGPVVAGVIGTIKFSYDLWGDAVNVASRMESHGVAGAIQLSESTYSRVRDLHHGKARRLAVKGKGQMRAYVLDVT